MRRFISFLSSVLVIIILIWFGGLIIFSAYIPSVESTVMDGTRKARLAVVFTGGGGRIERALELLDQDAVEKVFISGVNKKVQNHNLANALSPHFKKLYQQNQSRIVLGYQARSTRGNAREVASYLDDYPSNPVILITSHYHIPRSYMELKRLKPTIEYVIEPVLLERFGDEGWLNKNNFILLISEYHKTIASFVFSKLQHHGLFT